MSCPTCNANQNSTLENVHCETCGNVNCPTPSPCPEIIPTDCVIYTGDGKDCKEEPVYETGDSLSEVQSKIVDFFCNKTHAIENKTANLPIANTLVFEEGDTLNSALEKVVDWAQTLLTSIPNGSNVVSRTWAQMSALQTSSTFSAGQYYLINDFQTIYEQPDYVNDENTAVTPPVKSGPVQPLVVIAISSNTLSPIAFQPAFPKDIIYYDFLYTLPKTGGSTKGRIVYRKDSQGNECNFDFRNILFKRYLSNSEYINVYSSAPNSQFIETTVFGNNYTSCFNNKIIVNTVLENADPLSPDFDLPNIVFLGAVKEATILGAVRNVTVKSSECLNLKMSYRNVNITMSSTGLNANNILNNGIDLVLRGAAIENNQFTNSITNVSIIASSEISHNFIDHIEDVNFNGQNFVNNISGKIKDFSCTLGNPTFEYNNILKMENNSAQGEFKNNRFDEFTGNFAGGLFNYNTGVLCKDNTFGNYTAKNDLGPHFLDNACGNNFGKNNISNEPVGNVILAPFINCTVGTFFSDNTFSKKTDGLTIGNNFKLNDFVSDVTNINFATATHVYNNYNCKIYKNAAQAIKLSYYDAFDAEQTVLPNN
jgi:hypothetical protein